MLGKCGQIRGGQIAKWFRIKRLRLSPLIYLKIDTTPLYLFFIFLSHAWAVCPFSKKIKKQGKCVRRYCTGPNCSLIRIALATTSTRYKGSGNIADLKNHMEVTGAQEDSGRYWRLPFTQVPMTMTLSVTKKVAPYVFRTPISDSHLLDMRETAPDRRFHL